MKVDLLDQRHFTVKFGNRDVIIDTEQDVRIRDGKTVVKTQFAEDGHIKQVLQDDAELVSSLDLLRDLHNDVERILSHAIQPGVGHRELLRAAEVVRNNVRKIMRKNGWKTAGF